MRSTLLASFLMLCVLTLHAQMDKMQSSDCTLASICELAGQLNPNIAAQQLRVERTGYSVDLFNSDFDTVFLTGTNSNDTGVNLNSSDLLHNC